MTALRSPAPFLVPAATGVLVAALLGGCGGSDPVSAKTAEDRLVRVADALDACVAKTNDARRCTTAKALGLSDADAESLLGDGTGQVDVSATKALRYQLVADVGDDVQFAILAQPVGARKRVCKPAGEGECPKGGVW